MSEAVGMARAYREFVTYRYGRVVVINPEWTIKEGRFGHFEVVPMSHTKPSEVAKLTGLPEEKLVRSLTSFLTSPFCWGDLHRRGRGAAVGARETR